MKTTLQTFFTILLFLFISPAFVVELAAMRRAFQPVAKYLQLGALVGAAHEQRGVFSFAEAVNANRVFQRVVLYNHVFKVSSLVMLKNG